MDVDGGAVVSDGKEVVEDEEEDRESKVDVKVSKTTTVEEAVVSAVESSSSTVNGDVRSTAADSEHDDSAGEEKPTVKVKSTAAAEEDAVDAKSDDKDSNNEEDEQKMEVDKVESGDKDVDEKKKPVEDKMAEEEVEIIEESNKNGESKMDEDEVEVRKRAEENERKEAEILEQLGKVDDVIVGEKKPSKEQTIIITETKSLAKAINEAVKKPDGKPTLVIIESKSNSNNATSPGAKSGKMSLTSPGTGMTLRSRSRMEAQGNNCTGSPHGSAGSTTTTPSKSGRNRTDNSNVALKDDADINIYTPSLMVPYIYECPPKEKLSDFLTKIGANSKKTAVDEKKKVDDEVVVIQNGEQPKKEKTFFDSALGLFFTDIGLLQAQRWVQCEVLRVEKRKLEKGWSSKERKSLVFNLKRTLEDIEKQVKPFQFQLKSCTRCEFKTESQTVLDRHLETIHVNGNRMICSYCDFSTVEPSQIFQHLYSSHKAFGRLERPPALHQCPMCPVEDSAKARVTRHMFKCVKSFVADKNQSPSNDFEPPAKRIRHVATVATLKAMRAGASVDKMSSAAALTTSQIYQMQQNRNSALSGGQQQSAQRPQPPPIRPKPGDIRLSPAYVQSVLRGQYMSSTNVRGLTPGLVSGQGSLMRPQRGQQQQQSSTTTSAAYMLRQSNPVITSINTLTNPLQASQLFQVINPSTAGGLVPLVRSGTIGGLNAQRFTILPTPPVTINNRGPTPVALIPNLVTTSKTTTSLTTSLTAASVQQQLRSSQVSNHSGLSGAGTAGKVGSQKPNISITPVNKPMNKFNMSNLGNKASGGGGGSSSSSSTSAGSTIAGTRLSQQQNQAQQQQQGGSGSSLYVVCEICDGYIKDLDQLRNHMQWIHKVKIHPKMIHNRPPLNCQKCHFRFFTDQGLERHLLGSHGLVTSSMQENANKGKDGGRCIICGKVFLWKLVVHMAKDHKMTLKPAHLSYKCTVCSATFNMYRLFETHVYDEHSTVAKRVLDGQKNVSGASSAAYQAAAASQANKPKVNNPSTTNANQSQQQQQVNANQSAANKTTTAAVSTTATAAATSASTTAAAAAIKPATSRITLHPEPRVCDDCGVTFKRGGNCDRHWEPTKLKPCNANLCRVDKCDACLDKNNASKANNNNSTAATVTAAVTSTTTAAAAAAVTPKVTATTKTPQQKLAANGKSSNQAEKVSNKEKGQTKVEKNATSPPPTTTTTVVATAAVAAVVQPTKVTQPQSDGEDVFDMEVETVDENGSSPGYGRSDVESD